MLSGTISKKGHGFRGTLLIGLLFLSSTLFAQRLSFQFRNAPLVEVFTQVERKTAYRFSFTNEALEKALPVSLIVNDQPIESVLKAIFEGQPLTYVIDEQFILVRPKVSQAPVSGPVIYSFRGTVRNERGEGLAGVSVSIKNTSIGTTTDAAGNFHLTLQEKSAVLNVTSVGYLPSESTIESGTRIIIRLTEAVNKLDETVIIAYGTTTRRLNTGTISRITAEEISKQPVSNPLAAIQGRMPGLFIVQNNGVPGANFSVLIRGRNSIQSGTEPLYIIDGVIFNSENLAQRAGIGATSPFNSIAPGDIESIEVLKDADATAIYGSRGANGVILITTKKGRSGTPSLELNFSQGWGRAVRSINYLNTAQYRQMRKEAFQNDGRVPTASTASDLLLWDSTRSIDWKSLLIGESSHQTNLQIRYSGGNSLSRFSLSGSYYAESTVFPGASGLQRYSFLGNLNHQSPNGKFSMNSSFGYTNEENALPSQDPTSGLNRAPNAPFPYDSLGELNWRENGAAFANPLAFTFRRYVFNSSRLTSNLTLTYAILPSLSLKANLGFTESGADESFLTPIRSQDPATAPKGSAAFAHNKVQTWLIEPQVEWKKSLTSRLNLKVLAGNTWQHTGENRGTVSGSGYVSDLQLNTIAGAAAVTSTDNATLYRYTGLFTRISMSYADKLLLNLTGRRDGSSRFGPGHQYANFGAVGAAWILSKESFFQRFKFISFAKLRGSFGLTGNDQIGDYQYLDTYTNTQFPFSGQPALRPSRLFNPAYGWEQKKNWEAALELSFFKDNLFLLVNWFQSRSGNQIIQYTMPTQTGFSNVLRNFPGLVQNSGWEMETKASLIRKKHFSWHTSLSLTFADNRLLAFPGLETSSYASSYVVGKPLNLRKLYHYLGVDPTTGVYTFDDVNKDGSLNSLDRTAIRSANPKYYGGLQNTWNWKGLEVDLFLQFVRQDGTHWIFGSSTTLGYPFNQPVDVLSRWQKPGDQATYQRYTANSSTAAYTAGNFIPNSTAAITDASYIRLKNLSISYRLPEAVLTKWKLTAAKFFCQGQNLATFTGYKGGDPENQNLLALPPIRMIAAGLKLTF